MNVNYKYASPSMCSQQGDTTVLGLSPDLNRDEKVSFKGKLKQPLVFRDAMLMLREIVIADTSKKKKDRVEFFEWLDKEIEARLVSHEKHMPGLRENIQKDIDEIQQDLNANQVEINKLTRIRGNLQREIDKHDVWKDYYRVSSHFWSFVRNRDRNLSMILDPVITVHPDMVSFEAFSLDESIYGCLSVEMSEFDIVGTPKLGTTNIDFSAKLAKEMERFRTYSDVELSVNPEGFTVDTGQAPEYMEKKIDLPETWIKGFNQVSSAANLKGVSIKLAPVDLYDICSFLRRHKEKSSPRYMKWILTKNKPIRIIFEPFGTELVLTSIYTGDKNREEKIWGRRRWLVAEKLLPIAESFEIKLLGFGMPQFIIADMGKMKMTIGFTSWSANDWVKGTAFNVMNGFIGDGNYTDVYNLLKEKRYMSTEDIFGAFDQNKTKVISGIGGVLKRGEGYFDPVSNLVRFRRLCSEPIPAELYETTKTEHAVKQLVDMGMDNFEVSLSDRNEYVFVNSYAGRKGYVNKDGTNIAATAEISIDQDGQISALKCSCQEFNRGARNISEPCPHILALYMVSTKFTQLTLERDKKYKTNDIMELLL